MMSLLLFPIILLLFLSIFLLTLSLRQIMRDRRLSFSTLLVVSFSFVYPISGLIHIVFKDNFYRGYFDAVNGVVIGSALRSNLNVTLIVYIAALSLLAGIKLYKKPNTQLKSNHKVRTSYSSAIYFGLFLFFLGLFSTYTLYQNLGIYEINRLIIFNISDGMGRYVFFSYWLAWGVSLIYLRKLYTAPIKSDLISSILLISCALIITLNLTWTGGRSIAVLLTLPLIYVSLLKHPSYLRFSAPIYIIGALVYIAWLSIVRADSFYYNDVSITNLIDWHFGRYSMVAHAVDYTSRSGFLLGQTFFSALASLIQSPLNFLGIDTPFLGDSSAVSIIGYDLTGVRSTVHIVPGILAETFLNFGILGVAPTFFAIGYFCRAIDYRIKSEINSSLYGSIFYAYLGCSLSITLLNGTIQALLSGVFYAGLPLLFFFAVRKFLEKNIMLARFRIKF